MKNILYAIKMLKHRPRLWWNRLWIRDYEFHPSINFDIAAYEDMNQEDKDLYVTDLCLRRKIARIKYRLSDLSNYEKYL